MSVSNSITKSSLFISTQSEACLHVAFGGSLILEPSFGLSNLHTGNHDTFWRGMKDHILSRIMEKHTEGCIHTTLLVARDEATNRDFLGVMKSVQETLLELCSRTLANKRENYNPTGSSEPHRRAVNRR
jgi:hypothetical protein